VQTDLASSIIPTSPLLPPRSSLIPTITLGKLVACRLTDAAEGGRPCSFREIARDTLGWRAASSLWRALNTYRLAERYPELRDYTSVGVGHISVVLAQPEAERITLLRQAERQRWSRRRLECAIRESRLPAPPTSRAATSQAGLGA